jgi:acyl-CoA thioester hydrolase
MDPALLMEFPVVVEQAVAWGDMDSYQHVNNTVYFRYFENARLEYFRQLDWFRFERDTGIGPILAATDARFRKPLSYPDQISIGVRIATIGSDRFTMAYRLVSRRLAAVAAEGHGTIVTYHYGQSQKVPIPEELRRRIAALESSAANVASDRSSANERPARPG